MTGWRYIAQRATTGEFLSLEVPFLTRSTLSWELSAVGSLQGTISPETAAMETDDGKALMSEWDTLLFAEADGEIKWGGIVVSSKFTGAAWAIEAASFATYPTGIPYLDVYNGVKVDPVDIIRAIWNHLQSFSNSDLGVTVSGSTPIQLGTDSDQKAAAAATAYTTASNTYDATKAKYSSTKATYSMISKEYTAAIAARTQANAGLTAAKKTKDKAKIAAAQATVDAALAVVADKKQRKIAYAAEVASEEADVKAAEAVKSNASKASSAASQQASADGGAYKLQWWEAPDCGQTIDTLTKDNQFDWQEIHAWQPDGSISHTIQVAYPRLGRKRTDLSFVQGDNVISVVPLATDSSTYANSIFGLGAGEGSGALRRSTAINDGRLRRVTVYTSKDVKAPATMDARIKRTLTEHSGVYSIDSIDVVNHENAPIGSWSLGDDILVRAHIPWQGDVAIWHRIVGWSLKSDSVATLKLQRSDTFDYGA